MRWRPSQGGPQILLRHVVRLWRDGSVSREAIRVSVMALITVLRWAHAGRRRRATVVVSRRGSGLLALSGVVFSVEHR